MDNMKDDEEYLMEGEVSRKQQIDFVTLGMFIIDEIYYPPPQTPQFNILGGAGSYSAVGARLLSPPPLSKTCGWIIDAGNDFPAGLNQLVSSWQTSALIRHDASRLTTRGWNGYTDETQYRQFKYTTPKLRLTAEDLLESLALLASKSFHLICAPKRCIELVHTITSLRRQHLAHTATSPKPIFIWEPVPDSCVPENLLDVTAALGWVDVCSPNHAELGQLMGSTGEVSVWDQETQTLRGTGEVDREFVEEGTECLLASQPLSTVAIVVRCGGEGCFVGQNAGRQAKRETYGTKSRKEWKTSPSKKVKGGNLALSEGIDFGSLLGGLAQDTNMDSSSESDSEDEVPVDYGLATWIPAYHTNPTKVIDPTGGGNTLLGGLGVAMARGRSILGAVRMGAVSASFAIEQVGMPTLTADQNGERWNGVKVEERVWEFERRCGFGGGDEVEMKDVQVAVAELALREVQQN